MSEEQAPTLALEALRLRSGTRLLETPRLVTGPGSVACAGEASALVRCFVEPSLLQAGQLLCHGHLPSQLLTTARAGYAPRRLPADDDLEVREALLRSARLAGLGGSDVDQALDAVHAAGLAKRRLGQLSTFQIRLVGLAHGLTGNPALLLLEDPYLDLDDDSAMAIEELLEPQLAGRNFIASCEADSPWSRALLDRADEILLCAGDVLLGPYQRGQLPQQGLWLNCQGGRPLGLITALREAQAAVTETPQPGVLFIRGLSGLRVLELAAASGVQVQELAPAGVGSFGSSAGVLLRRP